MRSNYTAMVTRLKRRALPSTIGINGKVWSEELEMYLTPDQAVASGHGKRKRSDKETNEFNELLLQGANKRAGKAVRLVKATEGKRAWTNAREEKLSFLVDQQEEMAKIMKMIKEAKKAQKAQQIRLDRAKAGAYLPRERFMEIVERAKAWKDRESLLWSGWWFIQARACEYAEANWLWSAYFKLAAEEITKNNAGQGRESNDMESFTRTAKENRTIEILLDSHLREQDPILVK